MKTIRSVSLLLVPALLLSGCGGGGSSSSGSSSSGGTTNPSLRGKATVSVAWPSRTGKLVPLAANSVVVTLTMGSTALTQVVARPASPGGSVGTASFSGLAYGAYTVGVTARPNADGSGNAQGVGAGGLTVTEDVPGSAAVALASTVKTLSISPNPVSFPKASTTTLTASATDASGAIVLLSAGGGQEPLTWSIDSTADATLTSSGITATLTGVHSGSANVSVSMIVDDAGHVVASAPAPVTVTPINDGTGTVTVS